MRALRTPLKTPLDALRRSLFLVSMPMVYISFALPLQARSLGASALEIGGLFSIFTISLVVFRPLVGIGLDRFGRRPFFLLALLAYVLANGVFAFTTQLEGMYVARFCQGIAASLLLITTSTITTDLTEADERARAMGVNVESQARGMMTGGVIGFGLVGSVPLLAWQYSFATYALCAVLGLLYAWRAIPETRASAPEAMQNPFKLEVPRKLRKLMVIVFICGFANAMIQPIYLIYLSDRFDVGMLILAWAFLPAGIVYATLPSKLGHLSDRWGRANTVALGLSIAGCLYLGLPFFPGLLWIAVFYTIGHIGWAMADPARSAWIGDLSSEDAVGRTFGVGEFFASVGASLGPLVGGLIYDEIGKDLVFYLNGCLLLATSLGIYLTKPRPVLDNIED